MATATEAGDDDQRHQERGHLEELARDRRAEEAELQRQDVGEAEHQHCRQRAHRVPSADQHDSEGNEDERRARPVRSLRCGQRGGVELAVGGQRQVVDDDERGRHGGCGGGQQHLEVGPELRRAGIGGIGCDLDPGGEQLAPVRRVADVGEHRQHLVGVVPVVEFGERLVAPLVAEPHVPRVGLSIVVVPLLEKVGVDAGRVDPLCKHSGLLQRGLQPHQSTAAIDDAWCAWSFQVNFMFKPVLKVNY